MPGDPLFPSADITSAAMAFEPSVASPFVESPAQPVAPPTQTSAPVVAPTPVPGAPPQPPRPSAVEAEPQALNPTARYTVTTKVNGVETTEVVTGEEMLRRQMNARSFTQNQQNLRAEQRSLLQEKAQIASVRQENEQFKALVNNPVQLTAFIQMKYPHLTIGQAQAAAQQVQQQAGVTPPAPTPQPQPQIDPQALVNYGDVQAAVQQKVAEVEAQIGRNLSQAEQRTIQQIEERAAAIAEKTVVGTIAKLQTAHAVAGYDRQIDNKINQLVEANPALKLIPDYNEVLRFKVQQMQPQTPEELMAGFDEIANSITEGLNAHYAQQHKAALDTKAKLVTHGMAAPTGVTQTVPSSPSSSPFVSSNGKGNWKGLNAEVKNALDAMQVR